MEENSKSLKTLSAENLLKRKTYVSTFKVNQTNPNGEEGDVA